ncbi:MAG: ABC transporter substrate-binding protein [Dehalococcoidia bacterium]|nr:ABC transporter substrate-binding protein [Dehalococcoidia bacterium]
MAKRRSVWLVLGVLIVAAAGIAVACGDDGDDVAVEPTAAASPVEGATPAASGEIITFEGILEKDPTVTKTDEVVWGYMFEESGPLQGFGAPAGDGLKLAVQEINEAGGFQVGDTIYTIRLIEHDTRSDVQNTIAITTELIQDDGVNVIWGPASFGDPEAVQITQSQEVLHLCPCPQRELTSLSDVEKATGDFRWAFQTLPAPSKFLPPGARNTRRDYPEFDTFATICANSETGKTFCKFFTDAYEAAGFEHVAEEFFPSETTDFSPFLTNLKGDDPDIILNFVDAGPEQLTLLRQSWELDVGEFYIGVALPYELFESVVGSGIRDKIVSAGAAPRTHAQYTSDKAREFFEETYRPFAGGGDLPPAAFAALLTYDPAYMLVAAMQQAGTVDDTTAIAEALGQVHFNGIGEDDLYFDERHLIVSGVDSCTVYQGEMTCMHNPPPEAE